MCNDMKKLQGGQKFMKKQKKEPSLEGFLSLKCGRWDLNPHEHTPTRSLVLPVCQFRHFCILFCAVALLKQRRLL